MAKGRPDSAEPGGQGQVRKKSVMGYFRELFRQNPAWLSSRRNDRIVECWLRDHPDQPVMPQNVRNTLANLKSSLRRKAAADGRSQAALSPLEQLELQIDECLTLARTIDRSRLDGVIRLLRRARNEVVKTTD